VLAVVAVCVYAADRVSKFFVVRDLPQGVPVDVLGEFLRFTYVLNPGAAFSIGSGTTWIFAILASAVVVFIVFFARRIRSVAWAIFVGLLLGGTLGNLTDRLFNEPGFAIGHVIDFIQVWMFPAIFNVADIGIVSAMGLFIILTIRGIGLDGVRVVRTKDSVEPASTETS